MTMQAKVKCPHCDKEFTVRQVTRGPDLTKLWAAVDDMFKAIDDGFKKAFDHDYWKRK